MLRETPQSLSVVPVDGPAGRFVGRVALLGLLISVCSPGWSQTRHWPDPVANHIVPYQASLLTHGPMLGQPGATSMRVWVRTETPRAFRVVFATDRPLTVDSPGTTGRTIADRDNVGVVDLNGLEPNTRYYYAVVLDGQIPDLRMEFDEPWPSFKTLPDQTSFPDEEFNPQGRFNIAFGFGACASQQPKASGGHWGSPAAFRTLNNRHRDEVQFFIMNGDYIYEELRDGQKSGYRANYRRYMERGRSLQRLQRRLPWLFTFDDHEIGGDVRGRPSKTSMMPWYEYAAWANFNDDHPDSLNPADGQPDKAHYWDWTLGNCHFFFLDCRGERTPFDYGKRHDPEQSLLGRQQRQWLTEGIRKTGAEFVFLISSVPWFLPHTAAHVDGNLRPKGDTFVGYLHERELLTDFLDELEKPVMILTGDVHSSAVVQVTDNVWEFLCAPLNSTGHPRATAGNPPRGGPFDSGGRKVNVKWIAGFPNNVPYQRIRNTVYGIVQVNNITRAGTPQGSGYQWTAFDAPQVVVRFHDGHTGRLLYAEGISPVDLEPFDE